MYRSVIRGMLKLPSQSFNFRHRHTPLLQQPISFFSTSTSTTTTASSSNSQPFPNQNPHISSTPTSNAEQEPRGNTRGADYVDEQTRVLGIAIRHVVRRFKDSRASVGYVCLQPMMGWTESAMIAGAREAGVSPSIIGSLPRKEAAFVEFFMDECLQKLIDTIDSDQSLKDLILSERISKLVKIRLELQAPFISKWAQALSIQAQPQNISTSFKQRAMLVDEIWHAVGDDSTDIDWYTKRTVLGAIYSTTEVYMLTDNSPDFRDTWTFLDNRVKDAFDLKKSFQEAKYLAEAVGAGMGGSVQGLVNNLFRR